jgi:hypothetical protein
MPSITETCRCQGRHLFYPHDLLCGGVPIVVGRIRIRMDTCGNLGLPLLCIIDLAGIHGGLGLGVVFRIELAAEVDYSGERFALP